MMLTVWKRSRVDPMATSSYFMRVWPNDLDFNGHVNNGRYLTMADIARMDYCFRSGVARVAWENRAMPIVGDSFAKFRRDLRLFQKFEITTRLVGWDEKWIFLEHRFILDGRVCTLIGLRGLFKGKHGTVKPSEFVDKLGLPTEAPALPEWVAMFQDSCESATRALRAEENQP